MLIESITSVKNLYHSNLIDIQHKQILLTTIESTICSASPRKNSVYQKLINGTFWLLSYISYFFLFPWIKLGQFFCFLGQFLRECLFCCFRFTPKENPLDWNETLQIVQEISQIFSEEKTSKQRQEEFNAALKKFSPSALNRFEQHIVFSYLNDPKGILGYMALEKPITDRLEQEKWLKENKKEIDFNARFYQKVDQNKKILRHAILEFYQELQRKIQT